MNTHAHKNRRSFARIVCTALICASTALPTDAYAAGNATFELRPHCDADNELASASGAALSDASHTAASDACPSYEVRDPLNLQTPILNAGDVLDMDLIVHNPDKRPIGRFRAWISYDTSALNGLEIVASDEFPTPTPGENAFSPAEGTAKISGTAVQPIADEKIVVARIRMQVLQPKFEGTPLTYFDLSGTSDSRTGVFEKSGSTETNVLVANPGYLFVRFNVGQSGSVASSASSVSSVASSVANSASSVSSVPAATGGVFAMLQVQGVRITTEGSSVFLAWDALPSTELAGYNVYYGTTSGKYIQRRGVEKSATSITIRALPTGVTYYFAVRAANAAGTEAEFSQEVGVSVGNPRTSTSPLTANSLPTKTPETNGSLSGETGASSIILAFLTISAIIGTVLAFRRQLKA